MIYNPNPNAPERVIGIWRRSQATPGFWFRVIFTATLYYWLYYPRNRIELTNRRITQYLANLIGDTQISISLQNVMEVRVYNPPLGVLLGFGDVYIQTASGSGGPEIMFKGIERPEQLKQAIFNVQDEFRRTAQLPGY